LKEEALDHAIWRTLFGRGRNFRKTGCVLSENMLNNPLIFKLIIVLGGCLELV
jgi:hypothetical protein